MSVARRIFTVQNALTSVLRFLNQSTWAKRQGEAGASDFVFGNPHELPLTGFVNALQKAIVPQNENWFAYKMSERESCESVAQSLRQWRGIPFESNDILMTNGAFSGISVCLGALVDPGDEVIFISPPWFFYEALIAAVGGVPIRVKIQPDTFDLDLNAIEQAITARTRAIIINSPNNPTGKIYPESTLKALAAILQHASERHGQPIYLLSDEAYSRIIYDGRSYPSPVSCYDNTILIYTYGKVLLTPGQRIGFLAHAPDMPNKGEIANALFAAQVFTGYAFPNALLQHAITDLDRLSIDIGHLQHKRDRMVEALRAMGYELQSPEGTFYLLVRSPIEDDWKFSDMLADQHIFCLPGTVVEMPGYFRLSLTASDEMIERALPGFATAINACREAT